MKLITIKNFLLLFCVFNNIEAQGQMEFILKSDADFIKQNTLAVVLIEIDEQYIQHLTRKKDTSESISYRKRITDFNNNIREVLPKYFTMYKDIKYLTMREIFDIPIEDRIKINFLLYKTAGGIQGNSTPSYVENQNASTGAKRAAEVSRPDVNKTGYTWNEVDYDLYNEKINKESYIRLYNSYRLRPEKNNFCQLEIWTYEPNGLHGMKSRRAYVKYMAQTTLSKGELAFFFIQTESAISYAINDKIRKRSEIKSRSNIIKHKILLILKDDLDEKLEASAIKQYYQFEFKVVSRDEFDKAILEKDEKYCYVMIIPMGNIPISTTGSSAVNYYHVLVDASTGYAVAYASSSVVLAPGIDGYDKIRAKHFAKYIKHVR